MPTPIGTERNACYNDDASLVDDLEVTDPNCSTAGTDEGLCSAGSMAAASSALPSPSRRLADCDVLPDYYSLSASVSFVGQFTGSITHDRYGHTYTAGGGGIGTPGVSGAAMAGYLRHGDDPCTPASEQELRDFLVGASYSALDGLGVGVGVTHSGGRTAFEIGLAMPQSGVSAQVGAIHERE